MIELSFMEESMMRNTSCKMETFLLGWMEIFPLVYGKKERLYLIKELGESMLIRTHQECSFYTY